MKKNILTLRKGGLDTIIAYAVVMIPLLYVLVYMVATIYHFSVQTYMNQVVKEAAFMASSFGTITPEHEAYICRKLSDVLDPDENGNICTITYYRKPFDETTGMINTESREKFNVPPTNEINKADIIGIYVVSNKPSILGTVSAFNFLQGPSETTPQLFYSSYREEIIRNENPKKV